MTINDYTIAGYRALFLPGSGTGVGVVVGAQSVVTGYLPPHAVYAGNPAKLLHLIKPLSESHKESMLYNLLEEYRKTCDYRKTQSPYLKLDYPILQVEDCSIDVETKQLTGSETPLTDDVREFLFKRGIRIYTKRPFIRLSK